jgi:hypothetical protein
LPILVAGIVVFVLTIAVLVSSVTALALAWRLHQRHRANYVVTLLTGALTASGTLLLLLLGAFFVALLEPWPISLHQGPDTAFSRSCLVQVLGTPPPDGVSRVYCRQQWRFGDERVISVRFSYDSQATVRSIVSQLQLRLVGASERSSVRRLDGPGWWPAQAALDRAREIYQRGGIDVLWVQPESNDAYFQRAAF